MIKEEFSQIVRQRVEAQLRLHLKHVSPIITLNEAMSYSVLAPGKRLRPFLVYLAGDVLGAPSLDYMDLPACAIELIHAYSLIHDDLPAMDDAPLRRGRPTCHRQFSEATAILAGDALQPLAFEILASHPAPLNTEQRLKMIHVLAHAAGSAGMAAGQMIDIEGGLDTPTALLEMYELKTGKLFEACTALGAIAAGCHDNPLNTFIKCLGLAFQIQDDILDIENTTDALGKMQGIDARNQKITYPSLTSLESSRQKVTQLLDTAMASIPFQGTKASYLHTFAKNLLQRDAKNP